MADPFNLDSLNPGSDAGPPPPAFLRAVRGVRIRRRLIQGATASCAACVVLLVCLALLSENAPIDSTHARLAGQPTNTLGHLRSVLTTSATIDALPAAEDSKPADPPSPLLSRDLQRFERWFTSE